MKKQRSRRGARSAVVALSLALTRCGAGLHALPTTTAQDDALFGRAERVTPPGLPLSEPTAFMLAAGDVISVRVLTPDGLTAERMEVDATGGVNLPLAGRVGVGGADLETATHMIEAALHRYDRFVRVQLTVVEPGGHRATVLGAVAHPGVHPLAGAPRLADLLALAGGPLAESSDGDSVALADLDGARLLRNGQALPVSVQLALEGDPHHNVRVEPGDMVYVPAAGGRRVNVLGQVRTPRSIVFRPGLRLSDALAMAGGTTQDASNADIRVVRGPMGAPRVYRASLSALVAGSVADAELRAGDVVFVTESWVATVSQVINRLTPALAATAVAVALAR